MGYRYCDGQKEVLFPFGYGLSYTKYDYDHLELSSTAIKDTDPLTVRCRIKNTGTRGGAEIVQLYVAKQGSPLFRAPQELKGFAKVHLAPGEEREVEFKLGQRSFSYYNVQLQDWHVESGTYEIRIGASSRDIRLAEAVYVESTSPKCPFTIIGSPPPPITGCTNRVRGFPVTIFRRCTAGLSPNRAAGTLPRELHPGGSGRHSPGQDSVEIR